MILKISNYIFSTSKGKGFVNIKSNVPLYVVRKIHMQVRHGKFDPGKAQYSTPNFIDRLFLIY